MIKVGIVGYGNLGRGVEAAVAKNPDMELKMMFTRRDPASVKIKTEGVPVYKLEDASNYKNDVDILILCGLNFSRFFVPGTNTCH